MKNLSVLAVFFLALVHATPTANAGDLPTGFKSYKTDLATASVWANMRGTDRSIASKSVTMINDAFGASTGDIALNVAPNKYLSDSKDKDYCAKLSEIYSQSPLKFGPKQFESVDAFSDWFSQLSQGKGPDGSALYSKCDKDCSPSYSVILSKSGAGYTANVTTACNQPRDKSDDQYVINSGIK
jgi:hypothetical protein